MCRSEIKATYPADKSIFSPYLTEHLSSGLSVDSEFVKLNQISAKLRLFIESSLGTAQSSFLPHFPRKGELRNVLRLQRADIFCSISDCAFHDIDVARIQETTIMKLLE